MGSGAPSSIPGTPEGFRGSACCQGSALGSLSPESSRGRQGRHLASAVLRGRRTSSGVGCGGWLRLLCRSGLRRNRCFGSRRLLLFRVLGCPRDLLLIGERARLRIAPRPLDRGRGAYHHVDGPADDGAEDQQRNNELVNGASPRPLPPLVPEKGGNSVSSPSIIDLLRLIFRQPLTHGPHFGKASQGKA